MQKGKKGNNASSGSGSGSKKSANFVVSNNFSLLGELGDQEPEDIVNVVESAKVIEKIQTPASPDNETSDYRSLTLRNIYRHNQSWKNIE